MDKRSLFLTSLLLAAGCSGGASVGGPPASAAGPRPSAGPSSTPLIPSPTPTATSTSQPPAASATGPAFDVPEATLAAALQCTAGVTNASREPVLLVPGTTLTPAVNFDWNYEPAFDADGIPWCAITLPDNAMADAQIAGEYVAYAIRAEAALSHQKVDILGFSQGGMVPRWALRWWPDTRALVDAYVGIDPSNHGTADAYGVCAAGCAPAIWQQESGSAFLGALNAGAETFAGISYTVIYSYADEVVVPNLPIASSSSLSTGAGAIANIAAQSICPADVSDHLAMGTYDPVAYAVAIDAFTHAGPAVASRISTSVCTEITQPGVNTATFATQDANYDAYVATTLATTPFVSAEPTLAPYVR